MGLLSQNIWKLSLLKQKSPATNCLKLQFLGGSERIAAATARIEPCSRLSVDVNDDGQLCLLYSYYWLASQTLEGQNLEQRWYASVFGATFSVCHPRCLFWRSRSRWLLLSPSSWQTPSSCFSPEEMYERWAYYTKFIRSPLVVCSVRTERKHNLFIITSKKHIDETNKCITWTEDGAALEELPK